MSKGRTAGAGALGVIVIAVAIVAAVFGAYVMGIDAEEKDVTKYQYLADVSGLFEADQSPQYIEYNPSTNYTGYYTDNTIIDGTRYFGGVDFTESPRANNYKLKLPPISQSIGVNFDLSDATDSISENNQIFYAISEQYNESTKRWEGIPDFRSPGKYIMLSDLIPQITDYDIGSNVEIVIKSASATIFNDNVVDWVTFGAKSLLGTVLYPPTLHVKNPSLTHISDPTDGPYTKPILAAKVSMSTRTVSLYYDLAMTEETRMIYDWSEVMIFFDNPNAPFGNFRMGTMIVCDTYEYAPATYMDIRYGVETVGDE